MRGGAEESASDFIPMSVFASRRWSSTCSSPTAARDAEKRVSSSRRPLSRSRCQHGIRECVGAVGDEGVRAVGGVHAIDGDRRGDDGHTERVRRVHLALDARAPAERRDRDAHLRVEAAQCRHVAVDDDARRVELPDRLWHRVGTDHMEDEAGVRRHLRRAQQLRHHLPRKEEDGVAVRKVVEIADEDDARALREGRGCERLRLVRVRDHRDGQLVAPIGDELLEQRDALHLADDDRDRRGRDGVELELAQARVLGCVGELGRLLAEDVLEERAVVRVRLDEAPPLPLSQKVEVDRVEDEQRVGVVAHERLVDCR
eukprot:3811804-Prymnesium_polylepis.1